MIAVFLRKHVIGYMVDTSATYVHIAFFVKKKKKKNAGHFKEPQPCQKCKSSV